MIARMASGGPAGGTHAGDHVAALHLLAFTDQNLGKMPIARFNAPAMGKVDHVAIAAAPARLFDDAIGGRVDRLSGPSGHVDPGVHRRTAVEGIVADAEVAGERIAAHRLQRGNGKRSEEHTSELQSLMRISYAVFCLKKKKH